LIQLDLFDRKSQIENSNLCEFYKIFLLLHESEPIPESNTFVNNINYMIWMRKKHEEFSSLNNIDSKLPVSKKYMQNFTQWLRNKIK